MVVSSIGIGFYIIVMAFSEDLKVTLSAYSKHVGKHQNSKQIIKRLFEFIRFHSTVKRYVYEFVMLSLSIFGNKQSNSRSVLDWTKVFQPIFVVLIAGNIITICLGWLLIQMELVRFNEIVAQWSEYRKVVSGATKHQQTTTTPYEPVFTFHLVNHLYHTFNKSKRGG